MRSVKASKRQSGAMVEALKRRVAYTVFLLAVSWISWLVVFLRFLEGFLELHKAL